MASSPKSRTSLDPRRALRGVTAIELMTVLAVLAILLATAVPAFTFLKKDRVRALAGQVRSDLSYARLEAMRRKSPVSLCRSTDETTCVTGGGTGAKDWSNSGWLIFVDADQNLDPSSSGNEILTFHKPEKAASFHAAANALTYQRSGEFITADGDRSTDFWICTTNPTLVYRISLPLTGSPVAYSSDTIPATFPAGAACN